jgi:hypothetical protein
MWCILAIGGSGSVKRREIRHGFNIVDFDGDVDARKSTTRVIFFLVNSPVTC